MFHKILVALDLSENSAQIFDAALTTAKATGGSLMLLHILSPEEKDCPPMPTLITTEFYPLDGRLFEDYQKQWQTYETKGLDLLRSFTEQATATGVSTEFTQNAGSPGRTICEMAQTWGADLIVIGRRGRSGLNELLLGSVSNYVLHYAPCSVLTIQSQAQVNLEGSQAKQAAMVA